MKDWRGVEIKPGQWVVYATRRSSRLEVTLGYVWALNSHTVEVDPKQRSGSSRTGTLVRIMPQNLLVLSGPPPTA